MKSPCPSLLDKIKTADELVALIKLRQERGEKIVFTNGVFDILHVGHIRYLAEADGEADGRRPAGIARGAYGRGAALTQEKLAASSLLPVPW